MARAIVENAVVYFVGENDQVVAAGDFDDFLEGLFAVNRPGGIVGVDDHDAASIGGYFLPYILQVRLPVVGFIAAVVHRPAAAEGDRCSPQRVVRSRYQHFIAAVEQGLHGHHDQFAGAVAKDDVFHIHIHDALDLVALHDRLARGKQPLRVTVTLSIADVVDHIANDLIRRIEAERARVADIQFDDLVALVLQPVGVIKHRAADVVADAVQFLGFEEVGHCAICPLAAVLVGAIVAKYPANTTAPPGAVVKIPCL